MLFDDYRRMCQEMARKTDDGLITHLSIIQLAPVLVVGVSGSGKSTVCEILAQDQNNPIWAPNWPIVPLANTKNLTIKDVMKLRYDRLIGFPAREDVGRLREMNPLFGPKVIGLLCDEGTLISGWKSAGKLKALDYSDAELGARAQKERYCAELVFERLGCDIVRVSADMQPKDVADEIRKRLESPIRFDWQRVSRAATLVRTLG